MSQLNKSEDYSQNAVSHLYSSHDKYEASLNNSKARSRAQTKPSRSSLNKHSRSPSLSHSASPMPWAMNQNSSFDGSKKSPIQDLSPNRKKALQLSTKNGTPKFEQKQNGSLTKTKDRQNTLPSNRTINRDKESNRNSKLFQSMAPEENLQTAPERLNMSYSPLRNNTEAYVRTLSSTHDKRSPDRKIHFSLDNNANNKVFASKTTDLNLASSLQKSKLDLSKISELLQRGQELKSLKDRNFTFLDEEDEYFVRKKLNDCARDKVILKYRELFYKARETKTLVNDIAENNFRIRAVLEDLKDDHDEALNENQKLRYELDRLSRKMTDKEEEMSFTHRDFQQKLLSIDRENSHLNQRLNEIAIQKDYLAEELDHRTAELTSLRSQREDNGYRKSPSKKVDTSHFEAKIQVIK